MAKRVEVKFTDFRRVLKALGVQGFGAVMKQELDIANQRAGVRLEGYLRSRLKRGQVKPKNAALTLALKRGRSPLVDEGDLFNAIKMERVSETLVFVGINKAAGEYDLAVLLHEGGAIPVSQRMRNMFFLLWLASRQERGESGLYVQLTGRAAELFEKHQDWYPLRPATRAIVIPPRPFVTQAFGDKKIRDMIRGEWINGIKRAAKKAVGK